jgi:hypothetical protein
MDMKINADLTAPVTVRSDELPWVPSPLPSGEEIFVLEVALGRADGEYGPGSWSRTPVGSAPALVGTTGARLFVKRGHLHAPPPGPSAQ